VRPSSVEGVRDLNNTTVRRPRYLDKFRPYIDAELVVGGPLGGAGAAMEADDASPSWKVEREGENKEGERCWFWHLKYISTEQVLHVDTNIHRIPWTMVVHTDPIH
jgi:hypothetical protein